MLARRLEEEGIDEVCTFEQTAPRRPCQAVRDSAERRSDAIADSDSDSVASEMNHRRGTHDVHAFPLVAFEAAIKCSVSGTLSVNSQRQIQTAPRIVDSFQR